MAAVLCLVILCLQVNYALSDQDTDFPKWNHLSAKFPKYAALPMSEKDAKQKGWTLIEDNCADSSGLFHGKRYMLEKEHATILIFDVHGHIAGMQMAFRTDLKEGKYQMHAGAFQIVQEKDGKYYYITAYFTDPTKICDKKVQRRKDIIGDKLVFLAGVNKYIEAPLLSKDVSGTNWVLGRCFIYMGTHYWYDVSSDMDCDDLFPVFLLYNKKGQLVAWGYATDVNVPGDRVEHPPAMLIGLFFKSKTMPRCLKTLDARSTQHVYFTKVGWFTHTCLL